MFSAHKVALANVNNSIVAYVAEWGTTGNYVNIYDVTNVMNGIVTPLASIPKDATHQRATDLYINGTTGYIGDFGGAVHIVDISTPPYLSAVNFVGLTAQVGGITKLGNYMYILHYGPNAATFSVEKFSIGANGALTATGIYSSSGVDGAYFDQYTYLLEHDTSFIYVANIGSTNLVKFDSVTLAQISQVNIGGQPTALAVDGNYAYITMHPSANPPYNNGDDAIKTVDLTTMTIIDTKPLTQASGVAVHNGYVYATDSVGLHIYSANSGIMTAVNTFASGNGNNIALSN